MGKSARLRKARRDMRSRQDVDAYIMNSDWLGLAKHFEASGLEVLDQNMQPIQFESIEAHAAYLENEFTQAAVGNQGFTDRLERGEFDEAIAQYQADL